MLLYIHLYILLQGRFSYLLKPFSVPFTYIKTKQKRTQTAFIVILSIYSNLTHSQESGHLSFLNTSEVQRLSDAQLLKKAKSIKNTNQNASIELANKALQLSEENGNFSVSAQVHALLAKIAENSKNNVKALTHYSQAILMFQQLNDKNGQINAAMNYSKLLLVQKEFKKADKVIDDIIPVALQHKNKLKIARAFMTKGSSYYAQKRYQNAIEKYNQSIQYLSGKNKNKQQSLAQTYTSIAESFKRLKNRKKTAEFYRKALDLYTALRNKKSMARTLKKLAEIERYLGNLVIALDYSIRGLEIHAQIDDPEGRAKALNEAGIIYRHIGRYEKSLKHIYEAHIYYKKINDIKGLAKTSNQMGLVYTRLKQFNQARSFYQLTINLPEEKIGRTTIASALRELAVIDLEAGNYEIARTMAQRALEIYKSNKEKTQESTTARIIGNIYRAQNDDNNAIHYYRTSLSIALKSESHLYQIKSLVPLATVLIDKETNESIKLLKRALELSIKIKNTSNQLYSYRLLRKAEKLRGNINKSLQYAEKEISITAIIQNERDSQELALQKANLHSHKMEIELEALREKVMFDQLELTKKNNEIEIAKQARTITELELIKNKYASIALALLLAICVLLVVFIYRRFILSKKRNKELNYLAERDPLTNSYNRRILFDHMNRDFTNLELLDEYCIIMVDIDHFKSVNDTYGHSAGDSVLSGVANVLQGCVRQNDIVARFGGEEFCIILHRVSESKAVSVAEIMRKKVEKSRFDDIKVTSSFGVTSIKFNAKSPTELIDQADVALYLSKSNGRNKVTLWEKSFEKLSR